MIAGKGHEQGQEFEGGRKEPFDDVEVARKALRDARRSRRDRSHRGVGGARPPAARLAGGEPDAPGPVRAVVDTREARAGDLFVGLRGASADGGEFAPAALEAGAWGALVASEHAERAAGATAGAAPVIAVDDPLVALQSLARAWRRELGSRVIGVTGSTGKTSTKDILAAILGSRLRTHANLREPEHRDRPAADDPGGPAPTRRRWCWRWPCAARGRSPSWWRWPSRTSA